MENERISEWLSPAGRLFIGVADGQVTRCDWVRPDAAIVAPGSLVLRVIAQLQEYFARRRRDFDLPLRTEGTEFSERVWRQLAVVPYGSTISYSGLGRRMGLGGGHSRAVANAVGSNRLSILIPCHRVVRSDGTPGGYRGALAAKQILLALESPLSGISR